MGMRRKNTVSPAAVTQSRPLLPEEGTREFKKNGLSTGKSDPRVSPWVLRASNAANAAALSSRSFGGGDRSESSTIGAWIALRFGIVAKTCRGGDVQWQH